MEESQVRAKDCAKECIKLHKKIFAISAILIVVPLLVLFLKDTLMGASALIGMSAVLGGFFLKNSKTQIKYLKGKYGLE